MRPSLPRPRMTRNPSGEYISRKTQTMCLCVGSSAPSPLCRFLLLLRSQFEIREFHLIFLIAFSFSWWMTCNILSLCRPILSSLVSVVPGMDHRQASPRRVYLSLGCPLATMIMYSSMWGRILWVGLILWLYLMISFTSRCCASVNTDILVLLFWILVLFFCFSQKSRRKSARLLKRLPSQHYLGCLMEYSSYEINVTLTWWQFFQKSAWTGRDRRLSLGPNKQANEHSKRKKQLNQGTKNPFYIHLVYSLLPPFTNDYIMLLTIFIPSKYFYNFSKFLRHEDDCFYYFQKYFCTLD